MPIPPYRPGTFRSRKAYRDYVKFIEMTEQLRREVYGDVVPIITYSGDDKQTRHRAQSAEYRAGRA